MVRHLIDDNVRVFLVTSRERVGREEEGGGGEKKKKERKKRRYGKILTPSLS